MLERSDRLLPSALRRYAYRDAEADVVARFAAFHDRHDDAYVRANLQGHFTGSAWLVSADGQRVLLTHHRKLQRWLQLGGHADGVHDLAQVALTEAREESGLSNLQVESDIFDLDCHRIPARADVPEHFHYDVRHVVHAVGDEDFVVSAESLDLAWREIADIAVDAGADESLRRMARKWLQRHR